MSTAPSVTETLPQDEVQRSRARELSLADDQPPASVPGHHIQRKIGEGRFGSVWLARELNTGKQVAIKFYAHRRGVDWSLLGREVEKLAVLYTSRNIVGLLNVGWDHDPPYYVMEYLDNGSLAERLSEGPLGVADAVRIATRICQALVHAHGSGILHCDLKPANVLLDQDWEPRLCDFGQSRLVDERSPALGTLYYMAPEQADLKAVPDARWDVYGLGALLYHMVTGSPPYRSAETDKRLKSDSSLETQLATYRQIVSEGPKPAQHRRMPGVDSQLVDIIDRCLAGSPSRRLPNAQAVLDRLAERERQRSRRPLLVLGLVLPVLLLLFTAPLVSEAMYDAVSTVRLNLEDRALESDVLSVNLLASSLERELVDRREELLEIAQSEEFRAAVAEYASVPLEERTGLMERLDEKYEENQARRKLLERSTDASWFLLDAEGVQRWHMPKTGTLDAKFAYRDYFHGRNESYSPKTVPADVQPIKKPHVCRVYESTSTGRLRVALTVPVWDATDENVIGVLGRSINVSDLLLDYERSVVSQGADGVGRELALIDSRVWKLIAHSEWKPGGLVPRLQPDEFEQLTVSPGMVEQLKQLSVTPLAETESSKLDRVLDYIDPMSAIRPQEFGGEWLAAFSLVRDTDWVAVVQERREPAFEAVDDLRKRMLLFGMSAVLVVVVLVAGCWWLILRIVNERPPRWWPWSHAGNNIPTAGTGTLSWSAKGTERA